MWCGHVKVMENKKRFRKEGGLFTRGSSRKKSEPGRPLVSIITVCLNSEKYLDQTIQSVLKQTYDNIEYFIIDGGSTDGTLGIIQKYDHLIDYWLSEPDNGLYDAMNKSIGLSSGDLIAFINSGDYYYPDSVTLVVRSWTSNGCKADLLFGDIEIFDEIETGLRWKISTKNRLSKLLFRNIIFHPSCFTKKTMFQNYGIFDTKFKVLADYDFVLRLYMKHANFQHVDHILAVQRLGGLSSRLDIFRPIEYFLIQGKNNVALFYRLWCLLARYLLFTKMCFHKILRVFLSSKTIRNLKKRKLERYKI